MTFPRLRAKSGGGESASEFLQQHLADVFAAAKSILDATCDEQLLAMGLSSEQFRGRFRRIVLLAAAVHDLGRRMIISSV